MNLEGPSPTAAGERDGLALGDGKPLLLMDIDGVISLFGFADDDRPAGSFHTIDGIPHFLSAEAGEHLLALMASFEVSWCSGWEEKANEYLPHLLGLPGPLPYLSFEDTPAPGTAHWKLAAVDAYAGGRPLAWVDDSFNDACLRWARERDAATLLAETDPARGLTRDGVRRLQRWATESR